MRIISSAWPASCSNAGFASSQMQVPPLQQICSLLLESGAALPQENPVLHTHILTCYECPGDKFALLDEDEEQLTHLGKSLASDDFKTVSLRSL